MDSGNENDIIEKIDPKENKDDIESEKKNNYENEDNAIEKLDIHNEILDNDNNNEIKNLKNENIEIENLNENKENENVDNVNIEIENLIDENKENENVDNIDKENENLENEININSQNEKNESLKNEILEKANSQKSIKLEDKKNLNLNKYENYSIKELKEEIINKNNTLLKLNDEKEESKLKLNTIIKDLNTLISQNENYLYGKTPDLSSIKRLQQLYTVRKKDLENSKKINQTFKSQHQLFENRANNVLTPEKINTFEEQIDLIKKENLEMNIKIKELKDKNVVSTKELNVCANNKKFPLKIKGYTDDVKSLASKKHDYYTKLNMNKRSLDNLIKEKGILEKLYDINLKNCKNENFISRINFWFNLIKNDLNGSLEEIMERIETNNSKFIEEIDRRNLLKTKNNKNPLYLPLINEGINRARSSSPKKKSETLNKYDNNNKKQYQGIFNKYSILKENNLDKNYMKKSLRKNNSITIKEENKIDLEIMNDYFSTTDDEYRDLLGRKDQFIETNSRLENNIKEVQKTSSKKLKNISRSISDNAIRLNSLKQQNELLNSEIINLEKVLELTIQQNEIKNEIKRNESKFIKLNQRPINDITVSDTNILKELKDDDNKKKSMYFNNTNFNNIEEEKLHKNDFSLFHVESNKNIKFGDVSKIAKIDDDTSIIKDNSNVKLNVSREKKIQEIKNKYFQFDKLDNDDNEDDKLFNNE